MENRKDIYSQLEIEDLTEDLKLVAMACGIDTVRELMKHCSGLSIYIPKLARLDKFIVRYIRENSEKSFKEIARDLGVTEQHVKRLFREMPRK
ncbi:hypothetical protein D9V87_02915 [Bacteroidetes/Chlorobi group bacterium MS-B_bin-24]|jgi:predicted transcriptional regulator|nr:MAG: hypothetical protein D9V87_02915 [Bacteroidetes/Chlorobi group bacterium MS-B_bin-24]